MITLKLKGKEVELEVRKATCSFCGEKAKDCVKGYLPVTLSCTHPKMGGVKRVIEDYEIKHRFFGGMVREIKGDLRYETLVDGFETVRKEENSDICFDCIKQLSKLIQSK